MRESSLELLRQAWIPQTNGNSRESLEFPRPLYKTGNSPPPPLHCDICTSVIYYVSAITRGAHWPWHVAWPIFCNFFPIIWGTTLALTRLIPDTETRRTLTPQHQTPVSSPSQGPSSNGNEATTHKPKSICQSPIPIGRQ